MNNGKLRLFLKYLKDNNIIFEYENLFDKVFDFQKLITLSKKDMDDIFNNSYPTIRLYEIINNVKIDEKIINYISELKDIKLKKYSLRLAVSNNFNVDDTLKYINTICNGKEIASSKYAYSLTLNSKVRNNKNCYDYVELVSNTNNEVSIQIRDFLYIKDYIDNEDCLPFCKKVSQTNKDYIARYMIDLYQYKYDNNTKLDVNYISLLLIPNSNIQAKCVYELLKDDKFLEREDALGCIFLISTTHYDYQAYNAYKAIIDGMIKENSYNDLMNIITKEKEIYTDGECNLIDVLNTRDLDKLIDTLSLVDDNIKLTNNTKVKKVINKK